MSRIDKENIIVFLIYYKYSLLFKLHLGSILSDNVIPNSPICNGCINCTRILIFNIDNLWKHVRLFVEFLLCINLSTCLSCFVFVSRSSFDDNICVALPLCSISDFS